MKFIEGVSDYICKNEATYREYLKHPITKGIIASGALLAVKQLYTFYKNIVPNNTILELDLSKDFEIVHSEPTPIEKLFESKIIYFRSLIEGIEKGADDRKIKAIIVRFGSEHKNLSLTNIQEFRNAISYFKSKGKRTVFYADTFGEFGYGISLYYLASVFDDVYMAPCGDLNMINVNHEAFFLRKTLEKLGCLPEVFTRKEYKSALNILTEEKMTEKEKESLSSLLKNIYEQMARDIAKDRKLSKEEVDRLFETGPFSSEQALTKKLVDATLYCDEVYTSTYEKLRDQHSMVKDFKLLFIKKYNQMTAKMYSKKNKHMLALINCEGAIGTGVSKNRLNGGPTIGSESVSLAIRAATLDKHVKGIILQIDSPGGSYIGSDLIHHEVERAKKAGKKVIVSMGTYCASGGYFFACNADKIVAYPSTLTGSIGVLVGKVNTHDMWSKIGVTFDRVPLNPDGATENSTLFSAVHSYNDTQRAAINASLDFIYEDFTSKVADGRRLTREQVEEIARGRVWTGEQALNIGLVDKLGGFRETVEVAKEVCGIPQHVKPYIVQFPKFGLLQQVLSPPPSNSDDINRRGFPAEVTATGISPLQKFSIFTSFISSPQVSSFVKIAKNLLTGVYSSNQTLSINQNLNNNIL
eukprot:gene3129-3911_t